MIAKQSNWYKNIWSLNIKQQSWVKDTECQVNFIIKELGLKGRERILDLACGYGRHSLSFARKGFEVVGIDLTRDYIEDAVTTARKEGLHVNFIRSDIRDVQFENEFDVVLNLADGAIGYLENDDENLKIFDVISKALKPGGKHIMDICNAQHAESYFPVTHWEAGEKSVSLSKFEWDGKKRIMLYGSKDISYGDPLEKPEILYGDPIRLYSTYELTHILQERNMKLLNTFSTFHGKEAAPKEMQLIVHSEKY